MDVYSGEVSFLFIFFQLSSNSHQTQCVCILQAVVCSLLDQASGSQIIDMNLGCDDVCASI